MPEGFYIMKTENAKDLPLPGYMSPLAAGMDLSANVSESVVIAPGETALVPTGIKIALPEGYEAQIRPRSGLALKHGITMLNSPGTIDADYRGEIAVIAINHGKRPFTVERGMRIAQMVIGKVEIVQFTEVNDDDAADFYNTKRGAGGFGHTGTLSAGGNHEL